MRARNVRPIDLEVAAYLAGVGLRGMGTTTDRGITFRLQAQGNSWRVRDSRGRLTAAVCMHGHWQFFRYLFDRVLGAQLVTSLVDGRLTAESYEVAGRHLARSSRRMPLCECPRGIESRTAGIALNCNRCTDTRACEDHRQHERDYF
mgnify:CR=1 FL=1